MGSSDNDTNDTNDTVLENAEDNSTDNATNESTSDNSTSSSGGSSQSSSSSSQSSSSSSKSSSSGNGVHWDDEVGAYLDSNDRTVEDGQFDKGTSKEEMKETFAEIERESNGY